MIGAALAESHFNETDQRGADLVRKHFNTITPENVLKWEHVHPAPGRFDFTQPDRYVSFGERNGMFIVGHTLVWHSQTPRWVFEDANGNPLGRDSLLARMREHIHTVVGRYKGRIKGWDVVNEALNEDGSLRMSPWRRIIGDDYVAKAFEYAREADPDAELYYNDYSVENAPKRNGAVTLVTVFPDGRRLEVPPGHYLTPRQEREMGGQPDLILQLARHHAARMRAAGHGDVEVYAMTKVALNGRPGVPLIDPAVDLVRVSDLGPRDWVAPAPTTDPIHLRPVR